MNKEFGNFCKILDLSIYNFNIIEEGTYFKLIYRNRLFDNLLDFIL